MNLVFTIDTEPDDQWAPPRADGTLPPFTFANTRGLGPLMDFFHRHNAPVTWMTSYSVARDRESARLLGEAALAGDEIAGHLHGWETPPYLESDKTSRPFIAEYEPEVRLAKHRSLLAAHQEAFGTKPVSYRSGRWGTDPLELDHLTLLGYAIDSSIPPGIDFRDRRGLRITGPDFRPYLSPGGPRPFRHGPLWQVPVSILPVGIFGGGAWAVQTARAGARRDPGSWAARFLGSALSVLELQRLVWIRPLKHPRQHLVKATQALLRLGVPVVNVMFHSSEAFVGTSPISRCAEEVARLYGDLEAILSTALNLGAKPCTLRDAVSNLTASAAAPAVQSL